MWFLFRGHFIAALPRNDRIGGEQPATAKIKTFARLDFFFHALLLTAFSDWRRNVPHFILDLDLFAAAAAAVVVIIVVNLFVDVKELGQLFSLLILVGVVIRGGSPIRELFAVKRGQLPVDEEDGHAVLGVAALHLNELGEQLASGLFPENGISFARSENLGEFLFIFVSLLLFNFDSLVLGYFNGGFFVFGFGFNSKFRFAEMRRCGG